jgi:hypothetical protein
MVHLCLVFSAQLAWLTFAGFGAVALARQYAIRDRPVVLKVEALPAPRYGGIAQFD